MTSARSNNIAQLEESVETRRKARNLNWLTVGIWMFTTTFAWVFVAMGYTYMMVGGVGFAIVTVMYIRIAKNSSAVYNSAAEKLLNNSK